tara:strand:+ start:514 stop:1083 length:570 start_codon:yes stop_codon:yes gene_type:complete
MNKKILTQLLLILTVLVISIIFFKIYFTNKDIKKKLLDGVTSVEVNKNNLIYELRYSSKDKKGNSYTINSEFGQISKDNPQLILMTNVIATIITQNNPPIIIEANNATYNNTNYNTNFYTKVFTKFGKHNLSSDKLNLIFEKNLLEVFDNVIYKNLDAQLVADKIEINIITKDIKIYMKSPLDVVKIEK